MAIVDGERRPGALVFITLLAALLWSGAVFTYLRHPPPAGGYLATPVSPAYGNLTGSFGANLESEELAGPAFDATLADLEGSGFTWVRFRVPWNEVEPEPDSFDWPFWDRVFATLAGHPGIEPVVVLDGSPAWARGPDDAANPLAPPHERSDFGAFAAAFARRYGSAVRYYQVWNEPNIAPHWGAGPADPAGYLGLLREAAVQIRGLDPDAQILLAALAPTIEAGGANLSDVAYLDALYRLGGRPWFDFVAAQPYGFEQPPEAPVAPGALNFGRAALLREVMERHEDGAQPLWATAFGWNTAPGSPWGEVTGAQQAEYAAGAAARAERDMPWLGPLFWAAYCPGRPADDPWHGFALCMEGDGLTAAGEALAAAARSPRLLPPGEHPVNHPALHYSAGWRVQPAAADPSGDGETLEFRFYGSGLSLRIQGGPYWALYRITVDGQPAGTLPRDENGDAYLVLHDPQAQPRLVTVAQGMSLAEHTVRLETTGGWGQWALQGLVVTDTVSVAVLGRWQWWATAALLSGLAWLALAWPVRRRAATWLGKRLEQAALLPAPLLWGPAIVLAAALAVSPWLLLDLLALAGLGLLFLVRPDLSLPLVAFSIPFWPHPKPILRWEFAHYELLLWLGVIGTVGRWLVRKTPPPSPPLKGEGRFLPPSRFGRGARGWGLPISGLDWPVLALVGVGLLSALAAAEARVALREWRSVFLLGAVFYWLISRVPAPDCAGRPGSDHLSPWPLVHGLVLGMACVSAVALWQLLSGQGRVDVEGVWRVRALYGSPNNLALVLDRTIPLAAAVALFGARSPRRIGYAAAVVLMVTACVATFSKGALLLGLPAGLGIVLLGGAAKTRQRWPLLALGAAAGIGVLLLLVLFQTPRFADLLNFRTGTTFIRLKLWQGALNMALDHPWLGVGPDNFLYAYRTRYVLPSAWQELSLSHPHNIVLDLWTRLGLVGLLAGAWAIMAAARRAWRLYKSGTGLLWPLGLGFFAALAATVAHGLIDNSLFLIDLMALFMMGMGLLERMPRSSPSVIH